MELIRPLALLGMLIVPLLLLLQWWQRRRRTQTAFRVTDVGLIRAAMPRKSNWKRRIPPALFLLGLAGLPLAAARPQATAKVPIDKTSIVLAMDVSRSMCATDVDPNRLSAAQQAARKFVEDQPAGTQIGLVAFSGFAELVVAPTKERAELLEAIDTFTTARGTAIGSATLKSIDAIASVNAEVAPIGPDELSDEEADDGPGGRGGFSERNENLVNEVEAPPEGTEFIPDIVVLLTDGANSRGVKPLVAAELAVKRKVRVYTIGFGTEEPSDMVCTPSQIGSFDGDFQPGSGRFDPQVGGGNQGQSQFRRFLRVDEPTLQAVAKMTGGQFFKAENSNELIDVFADLPRRVELQTKRVEISAFIGLAAAALLAAGVFLSLRWNRFG